MRFSTFHALGASGDLANDGTHMKNTREYAKAAEDYGFTSQPAPAGTK
jgi:hypothetical protein